MINPIKQIHDFNRKADLVSAGYNDFLEASFQIEEALEGFGDLPYLGERLAGSELEVMPKILTPKNISRQIVVLAEMDTKPTRLPDVNRLDKACDAVVFAVGSMTKLGLNPNQITRALNTVMDANNTKLNSPKDEHGKLTKPANFVGPEARLQSILDERIKDG